MDSSPEPLLSGFPAVRSRDPDVIRAWMGPMFAIRGFDIPDAGRRFECVLNHCRLADLSLVYASYGSMFSARTQQADFFMQGFPLSGAGEVRWDRNVTQVGPEAGGIVAGPGTAASFTYDDAFSHLILKVSSAVLTQRLALLLDRPVDPPLKLTGRVNPQLASAQARPLRFLATEINRPEDRLPDLVVAELEDAVLVNFLLASEHNHSGILQGAPRTAASWQVRRAVDYMEQHWDEPVTIETLSQVTGTSPRSLFHLFRKTHGVSPMVHLHRIRLRHAKAMLSQPDAGTSVTKVGFLCGFSNLGHFAMKYQSVFGEKPSETLRNSQR